MNGFQSIIIGDVHINFGGGSVILSAAATSH